ncbi:MAG: MFS transporter [Vulcanimicrobiaceae bacterium]
MSVTKRPVPLEQERPRRRSSAFEPFRYRDFRLLWFGLLISNVGTWMQVTALGYLVVKIAGSAALASLNVGILGASSAVPVVLLSPIAGVVADRYPRRTVLFVTNVIQIVTALVLAVLISLGHIALWEIFTIAGIRAATQAFDAPARQSWVPLLVPRANIGNAIGLNSVAFNAPSVLGPPIAGILILSVGIAASFYINAVLTFAVVGALVFMKPSPPSSTVREGVLTSMLSGVRFLLRHPVLHSVVAMLVVSCLLVRPYSQLMPAYAEHVVRVDARGLGILLAATGAGAILGSLVTAFVSERRRSVVWFASALLMAAGTIVLGLVHNFTIAVVVLVVVGLAVLSFAGSSNVMLQSLSPDDMRGRAISVFSMIILGLVPAGSLLLGALATLVGLEASLVTGGVVAIVATIALWLTNPALRAS